jgi:hypothetical protein
MQRFESNTVTLSSTSISGWSESGWTGAESWPPRSDNRPLNPKQIVLLAIRDLKSCLQLRDKLGMMPMLHKFEQAL